MLALAGPSVSPLGLSQSHQVKSVRAREGCAYRAREDGKGNKESVKKRVGGVCYAG